MMKTYLPACHLETFVSIQSLNQAAAELMMTISKKAIAERGRFVISLSGGQTPRRLYSLLADPDYHSGIDWKKTHVFWGDERYVPRDDDRNNAQEAKRILLDKVDIPVSNIHAIPVELPPDEAAMQYEKTLRDFFGKEPLQFDLILLGLGTNGHTASLFPGLKLLNEHAEGIRAEYVEEEKMYRISMTADLINHARNIVFLVTGEEKAQVVKELLTGTGQAGHYPARLIKPLQGELYWFLDTGAASLLPA